MKNMNKYERIEDIQNIRAVIIDQKTDPNTDSKTNCILEYAVFYKDGSKAVYGTNSLADIAGRERTTESLKKILSSKNDVKIDYYKSSFTSRMEDYASVVGNDSMALATINGDTKKIPTGVKVVGGVLAAGAIATAGVGLAACNNEIENNTQTEVTDAIEDEIVKPDMIDKEWEYYVTNAIDSTQKQAWEKVGEFVLSFNNSQEWMERTNQNGEFSRFGFTPEETMAFYLRFNEFTDEELITICNGNNINADEIMNLSNDFLEKMNLYYSITGEKSGISVLFNNEHDKEVVEAFEEHYQKMMKAEDKEKEELMGELKQMFKDYFNSDVEGKETKARQGSTSYLLRTMLPAAQKLSDINNYKDKMLLYKTGSGESVEVKVDLFDEVFMCRYVQGFDDFNEEHFLKQLGYNPDKYYVGIDGTKSSIADLSCGEQEEKFRDADNFRVEIETSSQVVEDNRKALEAELSVHIDKDGKIDANQVAQAIENLEFDSEKATIDELTKYSYDPSLIADMLSKELEKQEKNAINANTFHEYLTELLLKQSLEDTKGTTGKSVRGSKQVILETTDRNAVLAVPGITEADVAQAKRDAAAEAGAERDDEETREKHEEEAEKEEANLQVIYDDVYNAYANGYVGVYKPEWANSSDASIRNTYNYAKQDGQSYLSQKTYADVYNYYNQGGTGEYNSSWANSNNSIIKDAYAKGKADGIRDYEKRMKEMEEEIEDDIPTPTPDPEPTPEPDPIPEPEPEPEPEPTPEPEPDEPNPGEEEDYSPIVDEDDVPVTDDEPILWDEDEIIENMEETTVAEETILEDASFDLSIFAEMDEAYEDEKVLRK